MVNVCSANPLAPALLHLDPTLRRDRCGSFAVHFKRDDAGSFQVDTEKQAAVMERVTKHVEASGTIAVCPEGQIAKDPPNMQPFRRGSFAIPIQFEMPIWGMVMHGCYDGWPKDEVRAPSGHHLPGELPRRARGASFVWGERRVARAPPAWLCVQDLAVAMPAELNHCPRTLCCCAAGSLSAGSQPPSPCPLNT